MGLGSPLVGNLNNSAPVVVSHTLTVPSFWSDTVPNRPPLLMAVTGQPGMGRSWKATISPPGRGIQFLASIRAR